MTRCLFGTEVVFYQWDVRLEVGMHVKTLLVGMSFVMLCSYALRSTATTSCQHAGIPLTLRKISN